MTPPTLEEGPPGGSPEGPLKGSLSQRRLLESQPTSRCYSTAGTGANSGDRPALLHRDGAGLLHVDEAFEGFLQRVLEQRSHSLLHRQSAQLLNGCALLDRLLDFIGAHQQLVHSHATLVARSAAGRTSLGTIQLQLRGVFDSCTRKPFLAVGLHDLGELLFGGVIGLFALGAER